MVLLEYFMENRGFIDDILGGPGLNRGRNHPTNIRVGDCIDWWRVVAFEPNRFLKLEAEMKIPGDAWLEFEVQSQANGSMIYQTVTYAPKGLWGNCLLATTVSYS